MTHTLEATVKELAQRLDDTQAELRVTQARQARAEQEARQARRRARTASVVAALALGATLLLNVRPVAFAQTPGVSLASLVSEISTLSSDVSSLTNRLSTDEGNITNLETKTAPITTTAITTTGTDGNTHSGYLVTFTGANVQIVNGLGYTNGLPSDAYDDRDNDFAANGLGNLIIGYNETRSGDPIAASFAPDTRTGSHNLIIGSENNYAGIGGIVGGQYNETDLLYDSVSGGKFNTASGEFGSVSGGADNTASGNAPSVSGGTGVTVSDTNNAGWAAGGLYLNGDGAGTYNSNP